MPDHFPGLRPIYTKNGTITVANSGKLADGGAAIIVSNKDHASKKGWRAVARIIGYEEVQTAPVDFSLAPSLAIKKLCKKIGV